MTFSLGDERARRLRAAPVYIWRSYHVSSELSRSDRHSISGAAIWEVAYIATSSSKSLPAIEIGGTKFRAGGEIGGKTALYTLREFRGLHHLVPALFISIETEPQIIREETYARVREIIDLRNPTRDTGNSLKATSDTKELPGWIKLCKAIGLKEHYRLSVQELLNRVPFDKWQAKTAPDDPWQTIERATNEYLARYEVRQHLKSVAEIAVSIRRARARTERWEEFALDVAYFCPLCLDEQRHPERDSLRNHLLEDCTNMKRSDAIRTSMEGEIDSLLDQGRVYL